MTVLKMVILYIFIPCIVHIRTRPRSYGFGLLFGCEYFCIPTIVGYRSSYIFDINTAAEKLLIETRVQYIEICSMYNWYFCIYKTKKKAPAI